MRLEDIVCDLKYAKELLELGFFKDSLFAYEISVKSHPLRCKLDYLEGAFINLDFVPTYTVAELGEILTNKFYANIRIFRGKIKSGSFRIPNDRDRFFDDCNEIDYGKEANVRAKMLIWLIKEKGYKL